MMGTDRYDTKGQRAVKWAAWWIIFIVALAFCAMGIRACAKCWPQKGHWDPVRGTLCYGEGELP